MGARAETAHAVIGGRLEIIGRANRKLERILLERRRRIVQEVIKRANSETEMMIHGKRQSSAGECGVGVRIVPGGSDPRLFVEQDVMNERLRVCFAESRAE